MLVVAGFVLFALGALSGVWLVLAPFGFVAGPPGLALWAFFPVFTVIGYLLAAAPSRDTILPVLSKVAGAVLLLLELAAAVGLVLESMQIVVAMGALTSLWYVLVIGLVLGAAGLASHRGTPPGGARA
ncbi:hypothetical protein DSM104443_01999 [Usitatibacter rugosus]|uniref:Uncharacterized protein n=1 Tax=Usitatibacter rugosus TaxID=2732067 RepID=A0A6M4GUB5_9PROT|nr:hypothetical protein [Usitatibacter rugosus]QJR10929.1 hypothetical protein DSM104443_01999 [Usitatibacter rugosus]